MIGLNIMCKEDKIEDLHRDIVFDETKMAQLINTNDGKSLKLTILDRLQFEVEPVDLKNVQNQGLDLEPDRVDRDEVVDHSHGENTKLDSPYSLAKDKLGRTIRPLQKYAQANLIAFALTVAKELDEVELATYQEVLKGNERQLWHHAMVEKMKLLIKNKTWTLVDRPRNKKIVSCKWILNKK